MSKKVFRGADPQAEFDGVIGEGLSPAQLRLRNNPRAQEVYKEAREQGYENGLEQGRADGWREGMATALAEVLPRFTAELSRMAASIEEAVERYWVEAETGLRDLSVEIAQRLLKSELSQRPEAILSVVSDALQRVPNAGNVRIRLSLSDYPIAQEHEAELRAAVDGITQLEILPNHAMLPGGCVVESGTGVVDATLDGQIAQIVSELGAEAA